MRMSLGALALALALGCGGDDGTTTGDGDGDGDGDIDAGFSDNELGRVCTAGQAGDCPADHSCQVRDVTGGSSTQGYCSPPCAETVDCAAGYTGPGTPNCFQPDACVIVCDTSCPDGLTCLFTGGAVNICVVAE